MSDCRDNFSFSSSLMLTRGEKTKTHLQYMSSLYTDIIDLLSRTQPSVNYNPRLRLACLLCIRHLNGNLGKNRHQCTADSPSKSSLALTSSFSLANVLSLSSSTDLRSAFSYTQIQTQHVSRHPVSSSTEMFSLNESGFEFSRELQNISWNTV